MTPYIIILMLAVFIAYAGRRFGSVGVQWISVGLVITILTVFAGFRAPSVGADTSAYIQMFEQATTFPDLWRTSEVGFNAVLILTSFISDHYYLLFILIALLFSTFYMIGAVLMTRRYEITTFLFISLWVYTFSFNGARQAIAAAICFMSLHWFLKRSPIFYFSAVLFASMFHTSAILLLPLYFLNVTRVTPWYLMFVVLGVVFFTTFLGLFVRFAAEFINERYAYYAIEEEGGGEVFAAFLVGQGLVLYFLRTRIRGEIYDNYNRLLALYLIGLIPVVSSVIASVHASGIMRLHFYFSHCAFVLWPMFFSSWKNTPNKAIFSAGFVFVIVSFYVLTTMSYGGVYPYKSIISLL